MCISRAGVISAVRRNRRGVGVPSAGREYPVVHIAKGDDGEQAIVGLCSARGSCAKLA